MLVFHIDKCIFLERIAIGVITKPYFISRYRSKIKDADSRKVLIRTGIEKSFIPLRMNVINYLII